MTSQLGKQTIATLTMPYNSKGKDKQTMKFGQLMEYNMENVFFKTRRKNVVEKLLSDPFLKN